MRPAVIRPWLLSILLLTICTAADVKADVKVKTRASTNGVVEESTVLIHGSRLRQESADDVIRLYQCDLHRLVLINAETKAYRVVALNEADGGAGGSNAKRPARPGRTGGTVLFATEFRETGQRKKLHGYPASQVTSETKVDASSEACSAAGKLRITTTGWYINLPGADLSCADSARASLRLRPQEPGCYDRIEFSTSNAPQGFPASLETTMATTDGEVTIKQELVEIKESKSDESLFEVPQGFRRVETQAVLMSAEEAPPAAVPEQVHNISRPSRSTRTGEARKVLTRACLTRFTTDFEPEAARLYLGHTLNREGLETVMLNAPADAAREELEAEAKEKSCAYFASVTLTVETNLSEAKPASPGSTPAGGEQRVGFRLYAVGNETPIVDDSVQAEMSSAENRRRERESLLEKAGKALAEAIRN